MCVRAFAIFTSKRIGARGHSAPDNDDDDDGIDAAARSRTQTQKYVCAPLATGQMIEFEWLAGDRAAGDKNARRARARPHSPRQALRC